MILKFLTAIMSERLKISQSHTEVDLRSGGLGAQKLQGVTVLFPYKVWVIEMILTEHFSVYFVSLCPSFGFPDIVQEGRGQLTPWIQPYIHCSLLTFNEQCKQMFEHKTL